MKCTIDQRERISTYKHLCDFVYSPGSNIPSTGVHIVWCHTHHLIQLLHSVRNSTGKFVIVAHASDYGITQDAISIIPPNVGHIFAQNVIVRDPRVTSIPIGSIATTWIGRDELATKHQDSGAYIDDYQNIPETGSDKVFENLALMDFAARTNPQARLPVYNYFQSKQWVTTHPCDLSHDQHANTPFHNIESYFRSIYNHRFIISPLGNGVDCGRNWQSIYLGSIPVIPRHTNIEYYENDLPIVVYDDITDVTELFLTRKWREISSRKWNLEKATISYWREQFNAAKHQLV